MIRVHVSETKQSVNKKALCMLPVTFADDVFRAFQTIFKCKRAFKARIYPDVSYDFRIRPIIVIFRLQPVPTTKIWCGVRWLFQYFAKNFHLLLEHFSPISHFFIKIARNSYSFLLYSNICSPTCGLFDYLTKLFQFSDKVLRNLGNTHNLQPFSNHL